MKLFVRIIYCIAKDIKINILDYILIIKSQYQHKLRIYYQEPHIKFPCLYFYYTMIRNLLILTFGNELQFYLATW